ncbi:hypothetical protein TIFTF001_026406 [Ficus carica]|uniref:Uncharacterized protein n=1 Tax=Ficus carica TaxID=3494 RepID=A0AA88DL54_FICCA|nr:hypothetical protein TIFTF001_026406 [Ficus carica]
MSSPNDPLTARSKLAGEDQGDLAKTGDNVAGKEGRDDVSRAYLEEGNDSFNIQSEKAQ